METLMGAIYDWHIGCNVYLPKNSAEIHPEDWDKIRKELNKVYIGYTWLKDNGVYGSREAEPGYIKLAQYYGYIWGPATGTRAVLQIGKYGCSYCKCPQYRTTITTDLAAHIVKKHAISLLDNSNTYKRLISDFGAENVAVVVQLEGENIPNAPYGFPYRISDIDHIEIPGTEGLMAEIFFFTSKKPPEETVWCPKINQDIPISQYTDIKCKYEACGKYAFNTQAEANAYRQIHCPDIEPTIECTIDTECPEGYECKDGICVKKTVPSPAIANITKIGLGAAGIFIVFLLISKFTERQ